MPNVQNIIDYENGGLSDEDTIKFFQEMIDSGVVWKLQGSYSRTAANMIKNGYCTLARQKGESGGTSTIP